MPDISPRAMPSGTGLDAVVARRGGSGVRAVAVEVTRRVEVEADVVAEVLAVVAGADQLVVAGDGLLDTDVADAVPLGVDPGLVGSAGQRPEGRVLGPDAGVQVGHDHRAARLGVAAELAPPDAVRPVEAEELGRRDRVARADLDRPDLQDAGSPGELRCLGLGELRGEAVEGHRKVVALRLRGHAGPREDRAVLGQQVAAVQLRGLAAHVELVARERLGASDALDAAGVAGKRGALGHHDVAARHEGCLVGRLAGGGGVAGRPHCHRCRDTGERHDRGDGGSQRYGDRPRRTSRTLHIELPIWMIDG